MSFFGAEVDNMQTDNDISEGSKSKREEDWHIIKLLLRQIIFLSYYLSRSHTQSFSIFRSTIALSGRSKNVSNRALIGLQLPISITYNIPHMQFSLFASYRRNIWQGIKNFGWLLWIWRRPLTGFPGKWFGGH